MSTYFKYIKPFCLSFCLIPVISCSNTLEQCINVKLPTEQEIVLAEYLSDILFAYDESKDPYLIKDIVSGLSKHEKIYLYQQLIKDAKMPKKHIALFNRFIQELQ